MYIVVFNYYLKSKIEFKRYVLVLIGYMYIIKKCDIWFMGIVFC